MRNYPKIEAKSWKWMLALAITILSFYVITIMGIILKIENQVIYAALISAISLISLLLIDKKFIKKVFLPIKLKDLIYIVVGLFFCFIAIIISTIISEKLGIRGEANPIFEMLNPYNIKIFFISSIIQFIAEEIIFIIPFLFVINKMNFENGKIKIICGLILSSIIFGTIHISTYNYNILQAVLIISIIRMGLSMSYIITKNLTVTYIVHILYDWILILSYIAIMKV